MIHCIATNRPIADISLPFHTVLLTNRGQSITQLRHAINVQHCSTAHQTTAGNSFQIIITHYFATIALSVAGYNITTALPSSNYNYHHIISPPPQQLLDTIQHHNTSEQYQHFCPSARNTPLLHSPPHVVKVIINTTPKDVMREICFSFVVDRATK